MLKDLKKKLPIRWLAPETLATGGYSVKTDVFSYGVFLWEVFMDGAEPYPGMAAARVQQSVKAGYRMPAPDQMPPPVRDFMRDRCWPADPNARWTLTQLVRALEDLMGVKKPQSRRY